ncbi:MAG: single-stranded-DNA-specific exonuclease RecJ [Desulfobulbaceae bacterium]|nr:single-stranded-DNA-specific exonuclease RecJ [Desulfobulbaceae bacterium]
MERLASTLNVSSALACLLVQRGFLLTDEARDFLYPSLQSLPSPFLMKGMREAVEIIRHAISIHTPIIIYGDYDVDGVTGTAVLIKFLAEIGVSCRSCHPDRFKNGYGLKASLVSEMLRGGQGVVVTVDCGISDFTEVEHLVESGWQVIITDHHQPPEQLPPAHAIVNPWQKGCQFPSKDLAGVGVSFYLAMGLRSYLLQQGYWPSSKSVPNLKKSLDLVAIGTISDMVPLRTINRVLTRVGLEVLNSTENSGLKELLSLCQLQPGQNLGNEDISFQIGPRLNAAGRMGDAKRASTLLSSNDDKLVRYMAEDINQANVARRELTNTLVLEAMKMVEAQKLREHDPPCLIIHGHDWHLGLIGIIASRLVDLFSKPVIVFSGAGKLKGSARSVPGVNIHEVFIACSEKILEYGGHSCAAGLSIQENDLSAFIELANQAILDQKNGTFLSPMSTGIDLLITDQTSFIDLETLCDLLSPFGQGNPEPIFLTDKPCRLRNMQVIGKEKKHLRFLVTWDGLAGRWLDGIGFGFAELIEKAVNGEARLSLIFSLKKNRFNGQTKPQITLHDVLL